MHLTNNKIDIFLVFLLGLILIGLPFGISVYDRHVWQSKIPAEAKTFTLTGNAQQGWLMGEIQAREALSLWKSKRPLKGPVIEVSRGDLVVLKLRSSDVIHGFSLKDFGIFLAEGIKPGDAKLVSFQADRVGEFTFSCNAICGDNHQIMQGTIIVRA